MSEHLNKSAETKTPGIDLFVESKQNIERIQKAAGKEAEHSKSTVEELNRKIEGKAISGKEISVGDKAESSQQTTPIGTQKALKEQAYKQTMNSVRRHLPKGQRTFSKFIHNNTVDTTSEILGKSVARPTGIATGALFALVGSSLVLFAARHYGFKYNFSVFILFFIGGYMLGVLVEVLSKTLRKR